jgi:hypothetical protein
MAKDLYSYKSSNDELVGNFWATRPNIGAKKILKQIFRETKKKNNIIFEIYNRMTKRTYKYKGNIRKVAPANIIKEVRHNVFINQYFIYEVKRHY